MKKRVLSVILALIFSVAYVPGGMRVSAAEANMSKANELSEAATGDMEVCCYVKGEVLASFHATSKVALAKEGIYGANPFITVEEVSDFGDYHVAKISSQVYDTESLIQKISRISYVEGVQANSVSEVESQADEYQWYLSGSTQKVITASEGINLKSYEVTDNKTPVIAVIDTGIDPFNEDLKDSLWINPYKEELEGIYGYDMGDGDDNPLDVIGHGTHVAGIIAAADDAYGIKGVADAKVMALKITQGSGTDIEASAIVQALEYAYKAKELGANVRAVNCSLGGGVDSGGAISNAVDALGEAGVLTVFAAGNDGVNVSDSYTTQHSMPYCLHSEYIITVGSVNEDEVVSGFSNYGVDYVDVFAPGSNILSDFNTNMYLPQFETEAERSQTTLYYNKFDNSTDNIFPSGSDALYLASEIGVPSYYNTTATRLYDTGFCDSKETGCIRLDVTRSNYPNYNNSETLGYTGSLFEEGGSVFIDVTGLNIDQNATYYVSALVGYDDGGTVDWETINMTSTSHATRFYNVGDHVYFRIMGLAMDYGSGTMYLDDIAVSKADISEGAMPKMYLMSGTSMATPMASAAVALLSAQNPKADASELRDYFLSNCVRRVKRLSAKCYSGGIVDMSGIAKLPKQIPAEEIVLSSTLKKVNYSKTKSFKLKAKVKPAKATIKTVIWKSSNKKYATVNSKGKVTVKKAGIGHTVKITATVNDGGKVKAVCKVKISK